MKDETCIFCKLANGDIPTNTVYEDEYVRGILDMGPATKGHALILPKNHYANFFELPEEEIAHVMHGAKLLAEKMKKNLAMDGLNLVQNNGEVAGQTVFHYHLHLIPRYENDGQTIGWKINSPSSEELIAVKDQINN